MHWIAPPERDADNAALGKWFWRTADRFCANFDLQTGEYSGPMLGIICLQFAKARFTAQRAELETVQLDPCWTET